MAGTLATKCVNWPSLAQENNRSSRSRRHAYCVFDGMKSAVRDFVRTLVLVFIVIAHCIGCAKQTVLVDSELLDAGPVTRSSSARDAGRVVDSAVGPNVDSSTSMLEEPECALDRECRLISEDVMDCSARRFVVSERDPRWARYIHDATNTICDLCGSSDAFIGVCEAGKCRADHYTLDDLQACEVDDDCMLGYSTPQFCFCSAWAPDPTLAYNKNRPGPGTGTYNHCVILCPSVVCPLDQDAGPPKFEARCNASKRCEVAARQ